MSEKSHVSMVQKICIVTGKAFDTNELLLDTRLKDSLERHTITGWGISPEVQEKLDEGYIALVGIDEKKSTITNGIIKPEDAFRAGETIYVKEEVFSKIFNIEVPKSKISFVDTEVISFLKEKMV